MNNNKGLDALFELAIVDSDNFVTINDNSIEAAKNLRDTFCAKILNLIDVLSNCKFYIKDESKTRYFDNWIDKLSRLYHSAYSLDLTKYFKDMKAYNPFHIIDDLKYSDFADLLENSYEIYYRNKSVHDKLVFYYVFNQFKKTAFDIGIRSLDPETLTRLIKFDVDEELNTRLTRMSSNIFKELVFSDEEMNEAFKNESDIKIESIHYFVPARVVYRPDYSSRELMTIHEGKVYYSQSKYDELTSSALGSSKK